MDEKGSKKVPNFDLPLVQSTFNKPYNPQSAVKHHVDPSKLLGFESSCS